MRTKVIVKCIFQEKLSLAHLQARGFAHARLEEHVSLIEYYDNAYSEEDVVDNFIQDIKLINNDKILFDYEVIHFEKG